MKRGFVALTAMAGVACSGSTPTSATGESGVVQQTGCAAVADPTAGAGLMLTLARVTCDLDDVVSLYAEANGWSGGGVVFAMDTADHFSWSEEHDLLETQFDPCGAWDVLGRAVQARAIDSDPDPLTYVRDESSFFTCEAHWGTDVMTYAFVVLGDDGLPVDCIAAGHDAAGLVAGAYAASYSIAPTWPLNDCRIGTLTDP